MFLRFVYAVGLLQFIRFMQQEKFKCPDCGKKVLAQNIKGHVRECLQYPKKFLNSTLQLTEYMDIAYLPFFINELEMAKDHVQQMIKKDALEKWKQKYPSENNGHIQKNKDKIPQIVKLENNHDKRDIPATVTVENCSKNFDKSVTSRQNNPEKNDDNDHLDLLYNQFSGDKRKQKQNELFVTCEDCQTKLQEDDFTKFIYADICLHLLCMECVKGYIRGEFVNRDGYLPCLVKQCKESIPEYQIKGLLGDQQFQQLAKKVQAKTMGNLTVCMKCKEAFQFIPGNPKDAPKQDNQGKPIPPTKCQHYAKNRFMCLNSRCKQDQCKGCGAMPFHLGFDCQQYKLKKNSKKCRYCDEMLKPGYTSSNGMKAFDDICEQKECVQKVKKACSKIKPCKHPCFGFIGEKNCLPCLNEQCAKQTKILHDQNSDSYCSVCFIQGLNAMPCVMSKCGHIYHFQCLEKRLNIRWLTPRIIFSFCHCPVCKAWIDLPPECSLSKRLNQFKQLFKSIQEKSLERLIYEQHDKDQKVLDRKSEYYKKPEEYALAIYAYFQCWKCKKPYFGGRKNCAEMMNDRDNGADYDPKELVCPKCCPVSSTNCPKHGKEFIQFKCKFCCSVAQWFCWGNTHFCGECHKKQLSGTYISKLPRDKLPQCQGPGKCPVGGEHGQNGQEKSIGCALCRDFKFSGKDF